MEITQFITPILVIVFLVIAFILIKKHPEEFKNQEDKLPKQDKYIAKKINGEIEIIENTSYREPKYIYNGRYLINNPKYKKMSDEEIKNYKPQYDFWEEENETKKEE